MAAVCVDNLDAERSLHDTRQNSVAKVTSQSNESFFRPETPDPESYKNKNSEPQILQRRQKMLSGLEDKSQSMK